MGSGQFEWLHLEACRRYPNYLMCVDVNKLNVAETMRGVAHTKGF